MKSTFIRALIRTPLYAPIYAIDRKLRNFLTEVGGVTLFFLSIFKTLFTTHGNFKPILDQVVSVLSRSFPIVLFSGVFVGGILILQFNLILSKYDAQSLLGGLSTSALIRAIGPLIISFLLAGKIGAYTTAELGTMRVTEQIDAIECLGTNPIQFLILPRFMGIIISSLILLAIGLLFGILGSMVIANFNSGLNFLQFTGSIPKFANFQTILGGCYKSLVYGIIVATVSCYQGYTASGGARGVGKAVTLSALYTNLYIVIANYFTSDTLFLVDVLIKNWRG